MSDCCSMHEIPNHYYCTDCNILGCSDCFLIEMRHSGHNIQKTAIILNAIYSKFNDRVSSYKEKKERWIRFESKIEHNYVQSNKLQLRVCLLLLSLEN